KRGAQEGAPRAAATKRRKIVLRTDIRDVERAVLAHPTHMWRIDTDLNAVRGHGTEMSHRNQSVVLIEPQHHVINPTNPRRALNDGVQNRLHVRGRAADDTEHLGGCCLMLQGLPQFCIALLDLLEQPNVLYSDDRLISKSFEKLNLPFSERPYFGPADHNGSNSETVSKEWSNEYGASATYLLTSLRFWKLCLDYRCYVMDVNRSPFKQRSSGGRAATRTGRFADSPVVWN